MLQNRSRFHNSSRSLPHSCVFLVDTLPVLFRIIVQRNQTTRRVGPLRLAAVRHRNHLKLATIALVAAASLGTAACGRTSAGGDKRIEPVYDQAGKLTLIKYDSNGDSKIDTWSYMDGARIVRIEIDQDGDGRIDRWEYYGRDQKLEKVGSSRANDGKEDAWSYAGPDGKVARVEVSTRRDGSVTRIEHYDNEQLVAAEEAPSAHAAVAFDTAHRGRADRRLIYTADGSTRLEVDKTGSGVFVAVNDTRKR